MAKIEQIPKKRFIDYQRLTQNWLFSVTTKSFIINIVTVTAFMEIPFYIFISLSIHPSLYGSIYINMVTNINNNREGIENQRVRL